MTTTIKNGTVVTADLTYKADVQIEDGVITAIGPNLSGGTELDATGCHIMRQRTFRKSGAQQERKCCSMPWLRPRRLWGESAALEIPLGSMK